MITTAYADPLAMNKSLTISDVRQSQQQDSISAGKDLASEKQGRSSTIQDRSGKCLAEDKEILSKWIEYCSELYNYESCGDNAVLDCSQPTGRRSATDPP